MKHILGALAALSVGLPSLAWAEVSELFTAQIAANVAHAAPAIITGKGYNQANGTLLPVAVFDVPYDSGPITNLFGAPVPNATASVSGEIVLPQRQMKISARSSFVPSGIDGLLTGTVNAFGTVDYTDSIAAPVTSAVPVAPGAALIWFDVAGLISFLPGAPAASAIGTLKGGVDISYVAGQHVGTGSASILTTCTQRSCSSHTSSVGFSPADGFVANLMPRNGPDGTDVIEIVFPTWGPDEVLNLHFSLAASAADGAVVDASHTATIRLELPPGEAWTSGSGYLTAAPVPEPSSLAMWLAAGLLGAGARHRGRRSSGQRPALGQPGRLCKPAGRNAKD